MAAPPPAAAVFLPDDGLLARAFWMDASGDASFEQARQQSYTPYENVFNRGYTDAVHWLRLSLPASASPLGLRITPAWLDEITLYDPLDPRSPRTVGDRFPTSLNDFHGLGFSLELPGSDAPRDIWLRLKSTSAHRLDAEVQPASLMPQVHGHALFWAALYSAVLVMILLSLLAVWIAQPDRVLGSFLVRHAMFTTFGTGYLGLHTLLLSDWLSPATLDTMFSIAVVAGLPLGLLFDISLLSTYRPHRYLLNVLKGLAVLGLGLGLMVLLGHVRMALELNAQILSLAVLLVFATAWSCKPDPSVEQLMSKRLMMAYYTLILGGVLSGLVSVLNWVKPAGWQLHILILHGLATAFVMSVMLFMRGHRQLYRGQQLSWKLRKAEQEVEVEQKRRMEQSQFLHMLMHELKTPLSVVSMALGTRDNKEHNLRLAGRAVQDMKAVIERCVQADRLGSNALEQRVESVQVGRLIQDVAEAVDGLQPRLALRLDPGLDVDTDRQLLQTILSNLLDNAARYGDPVTPVEVEALSAHSADGREGVLVRVSNTPGLAGWPDPALVFSKYYRASGAHRDSGSGLGLFLAQQLACTLQGSLRYQPTDSLVRFKLWIPLRLT